MSLKDEVNGKYRILIYGINYSPELTGIGKYTGEMAPWLAAQGHDVHVITGLPYYPEWEIHKKYRGKLWVRESINGVNVIRCPLYVPQKVTPIKRIIHEFSFLIGILPIWFKTLFQPKFDLVFVVAPPFHLGILALLYSWIRGSTVINHVQDLQVDAARDLGMIKNKTLLKLMFLSEKRILSGSSKVSTISEGMKRVILQKGFDDDKVLLFPNWVDENQIKPLKKIDSLRGVFGINNDDKVVLYSGNLGEKQGLEIIIEVAKLFTNKPNIKFVICGSGGAKDRLVKLAVDEELENVLFFPLQPYDKLSALLSTADIHLVLQKKSASDLVMPSKLTGILSSGGCAIVTALPGTSLYDVIKDNHLGILVEPESVNSLADAIDKALTSNLNLYRLNARQYTIDNLTKENIMRRFEYDLLESIT